MGGLGKTFFSWEEIEEAKKEIDYTIYHISMQYAKEDYLKDANPCPKCGSPPKDLFWLGIQSSPESWKKGEGKAGFLTLCEKCSIQVDFFRDKDLEDAIKGEYD